MASFACGTRDEPFPCYRLPPPLTCCGLSGLMRERACLLAEAWPVMCIAETASQNSRLEWDAVSACDTDGKPHPTSITNSGSHFPPEPSTGNRVPFLDRIPGWTFQNPAHPESPSHSERIGAWNYQLIRPSINKGAPSRALRLEDGPSAYPSGTKTAQP